MRVITVLSCSHRQEEIIIHRTLDVRKSERIVVGETSWAFLLVGSFAAVGAAMAVGTLGALVRYHRTGEFPNANAEQAPARIVFKLWVRVVIGAVLAVIGTVMLLRSGLL